MFDALGKSFGLLAEPSFWATALKTLLLTVPLAALAFWAGLRLAHMLPHSPYPLLESIIEVAGAFAAFFAALLLFPALASLVVGLFLDDIAEATERRYYPGDPPGTPMSLAASMAMGFRLAGLMIFVNLAMLPVYLILLVFPPLVAAAYTAVNGWLLSREYFGMVAARHGDRTVQQALLRRFSGRVFLTGCVIAILFSVPVLNLVAPLIGTALMVHVFKGVAKVART